MKATFAIAAALLLAATAHAQERSAGQSYDAQTNWSALKASIDGLRSQNEIIAKTLDATNKTLETTNKELAAVTACNAGKMVYAPADPAADSHGCVAASGKNCGQYKSGQIIDIQTATTGQCIYVDGDGQTHCGSWNTTGTYTTIRQCVDGTVKTVKGTSSGVSFGRGVR